MSLVKNKQVLYLVVRSDKSVCAIALSEQKADELCGEYTQMMLDASIPGYSFSVQGQVFYDE